MPILYSRVSFTGGSFLNPWFGILAVGRRSVALELAGVRAAERKVAMPAARPDPSWTARCALPLV